MAEKERKRNRKKTERRITVQDTLPGILPPGFQMVAPSIVIAAERKQVLQDRRGTYADAHNRVAAIEGRRTQPQQSVSRQLLEQTPNAMVLSSLDPLEEFRRSQHLDTERERLMNSLLAELTLENGLTALRATEAKLDKPLSQSMEDVTKKYPNITQTEILLFGLCTEIPEIFVTGEVYEIDKDQEIERVIRSVPFIMGASIEGLSCIPDTLNPNELQPEDIYSYVGITGADESIVTAPYKPKIKDIIKKLIPLLITNSRLHEKLWNSDKIHSALLDGFGKVDRMALEQVVPAAPKDVALADILKQLTTQELELFDQKRQALEDTIARNTVVDLYANKILETEDRFKLIGLLDHIPSIFTDTENPFEGYFIPYGLGLLFLHADGKVAEYVHYTPYYLRDVIRGIYNEEVDVHKDNKTVALLFNTLADQARGKVMAQSEHTGDEPSPLEGIALDTKLRWNIDLGIFPHIDLTAPEWIEAAAIEDRLKVEPTYKFSHEEAAQIYMLLQYIPPSLLSGISRIRKDVNSALPMQALLMGGDMLGTYNTKTKTISLRQAYKSPFSEFSPEMKELRAFAFVHEVGHHVWEKLTPYQRNAWKAISWLTNDTPIGGDAKNNFLTNYSNSVSPEEDFSEHFAAFVLHGPEFRSKLQSAPVLAQKYAQLKEVFLQFAEKPVEYTIQPRYTLEELTGYTTEEIQRLDINDARLIDAALQQEEAVTSRRRQAYKNMEGTISWLNHQQGEEDQILGEELAEKLGTPVQKAFAEQTIREIQDVLEMDDDEAIEKARQIFTLMIHGDIEELNRRINASNLSGEERESLVELIREAQQSWEKMDKMPSDDTQAD